MLKTAQILLVVVISTGTLAAEEAKRKAVFILLDGIPAETIERLKPPNIGAIAKAGFYVRAHVGGEKGGYSQSPTISAVGYNSLLTGTWVNKHQVTDNDIKTPNYHYWTIFRLLKEGDAKKTTAIFSTWQDNRIKLLGEGLPQSGNLRLDFKADGYEFDPAFPHDEQKTYLRKIDGVVAQEAARVIKSDAPDLSWVYLEYTDDVGHMHGDSAEFDAAVSNADKLVGEVWESVQRRQKEFKEDWLIVVTTDHGRDPKDGKSHGEQSDRERMTWIASNASKVNPWFKNHPAAIVDIAPTIARHLGVEIPREQAMEMDGVPLIGPLSMVDAAASYANGTITCRWTPVESQGTMKIWLSSTDNFKNGGKDEYRLMKEVSVAKNEAVVDVRKYPSSFYKIVFEGPSNCLNRWVITDAK